MHFSLFSCDFLFLRSKYTQYRSKIQMNNCFKTNVEIEGKKDKAIPVTGLGGP
jgi:hypothetical protein